MNTVGFMSNARPTTYMVDDDVSVALFDKAAASLKDGTSKTASAYVNKLLKWALENYKDEVRNDLEKQVSNS